MIIGHVDSRYEIVIPLTIRSGFGQEEVIDVILDTGFTGTLILPPAMIARLGLRWRSQVWSVLANGTAELSDVFGATVLPLLGCVGCFYASLSVGRKPAPPLPRVTRPRRLAVEPVRAARVAELVAR